MILLDTHAWVWLVSNPGNLSEAAKNSLETAMEENAVYVSSISVWEVALLVLRKRLKLTMDVNDWIRKSEQLPFMKFVPINNFIAVQSVYLSPPLHKDPADRIIIATAKSMGMPIVTKDDKIRNYKHIKTIW